jgi:hypothetical protein
MISHGDDFGFDGKHIKNLQADFESRSLIRFKKIKANENYAFQPAFA